MNLITFRDGADPRTSPYAIRNRPKSIIYRGQGHPPKVLPQRDILRFLRLITSPACRRDPQHVLLSVIAVMCGVSRFTLYNILWTGRVSDDMCEVLTPIVRAYEASKLKCRRSGPRSRHPNLWEIVET